MSQRGNGKEGHQSAEGDPTNEMLAEKIDFEMRVVDSCAIIALLKRFPTSQKKLQIP